MHAPRTACEQLFRFHSKCRLGWHGYPRKNEDDLNAGSYALIQLYHISDIGRFDNRKTFMQFWDDPDYYFGPIFDKHGGCTRDWDPLFWIPIYVANLNQFGIATQDVFSGKFIQTIKPWAANQLKTAKKKREDKVRLERQRRDDLLDQMGDHWWKEMNKTGETSPLCTREEKIEAQKYMEHKKIQMDQQLEDDFAIPTRK
jgi:hypothetical protein